MRNGPPSAPEPLPIVVRANTDQTSAVARFVLASLMVMGILGAVVLPVHDRLMGTTGSRAPGEYTPAAVSGAVVALVAGIYWVLGLPVSWTVDAGGITKVGPIGHRELRWGETRRVIPFSHGYEFYGRSGLIPITLSWDAVPKDRREAVRTGVEAVLREHFYFPRRPPVSIPRALAWLFVVPAIVFGPALASWWFWARLLIKSPRTILGSDWVQRLFAWNPHTAQTVLYAVFLGPGLAYSALAAGFILRKIIREAQILPKRPGEQ